MEFTRCYPPLEWEKRWRREKERLKRVIEDGGKEELEQDNREMQRIVAYNDSRMGKKGWSEVRTGDTRQEGTGEHTSKEEFGKKGLVHIYCSDSYLKKIFLALKEFLDSSVLIDLTLITYDDKSFQVHSPILAAVSSFIEKRLRNEGNDHSENNGGNVQRKTVSLGPDVDHIGLQAIVEFAYTGDVQSLDKDNIVLIRAAAQALAVPRLLELCNKVMRIMEVGTPVNEEQKALSLQQMKITLQSIEHLWADRVGCDVTLDVDGSSFDGEYTLFHNFDCNLRCHFDNFS